MHASGRIKKGKHPLQDCQSKVFGMPNIICPNTSLVLGMSFWWWVPAFQDRWPFLNARGRTWQA
eukprot:276449-Pelagomonas_calceolata.AAC.1